MPRSLSPLALAAVLVAVPAPRATAAPVPGLRLDVQEAVVTALRNNHDLKVQTLDYRLRQTEPEQERAAFDPVLGAEASLARKVGRSRGASGLSRNGTDGADLAVELSRRAPSGLEAAVGLGFSRDRAWGSNSLYGARLGLDLDLPLRQGAGRAVNLVALRRAELNAEVSLHELNAYVLTFLAAVERRYWDLFLAKEELEIVRESLDLARRQLRETDQRIGLGSLPETERAAGEAELALRESDLINAQSAAATARIALLRQLNPETERFWECRLEIIERPSQEEELAASPNPHVESAVDRRPELKQAELLLQRDELELVRTRNGLLPRLDFFATLGTTGYATSFEEAPRGVGEGTYDALAGFRFELPQGRRAARAEHERARFTVEQQREALSNLRQLIQEEVLNAYLEAARARQQIKASAKLVQKQQEKLRVETVKFKLGKSTAFVVAQAQRDLAEAKTTALKANVASMNALVDLYRLDGSLAARYGVEALRDLPGASRR